LPHPNAASGRRRLWESVEGSQAKSSERLCTADSKKAGQLPRSRSGNGGDQKDLNVTSVGQFGIPLKTHLTAELSGRADAG
jgi:hypothetical protein